MNWVKNFPRRI
jgi:hypothetical protein